MALDTRDKRASALLAGLRGGLLPTADGTVGQTDRQQLSTLYRGVLAQILDDADDRASMLGLGLPFGFPLPSPAGALSQRDRQQAAHSYRGVAAQTISLADRRASMLGIGLPFGFPLPGPSGVTEAPTQFDRQQLVNSYNGILAGAPVGGIMDATLSANEVVELAMNGTLVGSVIPEGAGSPVTFSLLNSAGGAFSIGAATGEITVANGTLLDFEASPADKSVTVQISDGASTLIKAFTIIVLNAGPTDFDMSNQSVAEMSAAGTLVGTVTNIVDGTAPYSFAFAPGGNPNGLFDIDGSGNVTVAPGSPLDFESSPEHQIAIQITDAQGESYTKSFTISVLDVNESPSVQVIPIAQDGMPEDVEDAYDLVTEDGAILQMPVGTFVWSRGITIPTNGFSVHIRGADWSPASTGYLTATTEAQALVAVDNFEPLTKITTVGSSANDDVSLFTIQRSGCTVSRLWLEGRGKYGGGGSPIVLKDDDGIQFDNMEDQVVYWCRFEDFKGEGLRCSGTPDRTLITNCTFTVNNQPGGLPADEAISGGVLLWYTPSSSVYNMIDWDSVVGTFSQPYVQRSLFVDCTHSVDFTRNAYGVFRSNISVGGAGNFAQVRGHGRWFTASGSQIPSFRGAEVYDNVYFRSSSRNCWRYLDLKGGDYVVVDNDVTGTGNFMQASPETTTRNPKLNDSPPGLNRTCSQLPFPGNDYTGLTREANLVGNRYRSSSGDSFSNVTVTSGHVAGDCSVVNQLKGSGTQVDGDLYFGARAGWSKAGAHPLMPSDVTS